METFILKTRLPEAITVSERNPDSSELKYSHCSVYSLLTSYHDRFFALLDCW